MILALRGEACRQRDSDESAMTAHIRLRMAESAMVEGERERYAMR